MVAEILNRLAKLSPERRLLRSRGQRLGTHGYDEPAL